ncbi:MAG: Crp/Fnr family transcriptional regulator [Spirochaetes bacterium]|nr:Crp/Fnr family transcriptional regulator [Spirochaetota bacterium]
MDHKINFKIEKKSYAKDSVIILQGSSTKCIYFLHKGSIEIKRLGDNVTGLSESQVIEKSKRVGVIEAPSIFGIINIINSKDHDSSYVALSDSLITKYIIPTNDFISFFESNPPIALNVLLTLQEHAGKRLINLKKYVDYLGLIDKFTDNFKLLYLIVNGIKKDPLYDKYIKNGGILPSLIDSTFLKNDYSTILGKNYVDKSYNPYEKFDGRQIKFFNNLLKSKSGYFISIISHDNHVFLYMFETLTTLLNLIDIDTEKLASTVEQKLSYFFLDKNSPFNLLYSISDKIKNNKNIDGSITNTIVSICRNIDLINKQLGGKEHIEVFSKYDVLSTKEGTLSFVSRAGPIVQKSGLIQEPLGRFQIMLADSSRKIIAYSTLKHEDKERILKNLSRMRKINYEDLTSGENRKIIRNLQTDFFELYQNIFLKAIKETNIPQHILLFLYFAYIDERLITEKQLEFLYNSMNLLTTGQNTLMPIITLFDYLKLIYNKEEEPSLSERGEFRKIVNKNFGRANKIVEDTPLGRLEYEILYMATNVMRITSDNMRAYIPYLTDKTIRGSIHNLFVSPKKLDAYVKKILSIDYSLFFRELTWKIPGKSELIQKEIYPYFILLPNTGPRVQMWQEMVYNNRSSRARFFLPVIFNGDLEKSLIFSCGHFRWNLNKAVVSNWMDPVEGGLTGAYYDYEQSYKKIPDLTEEAKDRIKKQIKSIKIDRNRFATDYHEWIVIESQGNPKLNKILRKIFYRYVPFSKEIRANISKLPVYTDLDRKYEIIRDREFKRLEAKYKKYKEGDNLPEDLRAYLEMFSK